ncbi:YALIA101S06e04874g1_1 [Yarrowia lipolytica]|nr:Hypothetical protein YALI2_D00478g [Yarrowia lipolytica]SEI35222.1 YALIA101S06e04874g1_1 [Yarrowia lipolytica]
MGLFTKKSREALSDTPKLSALAQQPDLPVLSPPPLPAASQRAVSGGSVSSLNEPKGYTLRGKLGLAKAPQNVFDGFDGAQVPDGASGYNDSIYDEQLPDDDASIYDRSRYEESVYGDERNAQKQQPPQSEHSSSNNTDSNLPPPINTFVQHGTVKQYTPEFGGAEFPPGGTDGSSHSPHSSQFASPTGEFHSNRSSPVKPPPITIPKGRSSPLASGKSPIGISSSFGMSPSTNQIRSPLGSPSYMLPTSTYGESPKGSGMASAAAALAMGVSSFKTPPLAQKAQFGSPQTFSTPSQALESTHPADHVNCSHGGHSHSHAASPGSPRVTSPTVRSPPPPLAHPGYPKEHYIAKKKSSEALGEVLPGRDLYAEAKNDYPYPLTPADLKTAPYPTCYYQKGCREIGPHSHEEEEKVDPVFATFDQSKYDEIQRESRDQQEKEKLMWGKSGSSDKRLSTDQQRAELSSTGSDKSRGSEPHDTGSGDSASNRTESRAVDSSDSRFAEAESRATESAESRFEEAQSHPGSSHAESVEPEYIPADLDRAESSIYPAESVYSANRAEETDPYAESVYSTQQEQQSESYDQNVKESHDQSTDHHHNPPPSSIDDFDFNSGAHTPTNRLPLDSPGTPGTPELTRDFNRLSVSHIKGMGLPLDTRSIGSGEGHAPQNHVNHSVHHVGHEADLNHGQVTHGQVVGGGSTNHMMLAEPSQAEILRSSYISTDSGGGLSHMGGPIGSTGHVMDRHMMSPDQEVLEGHVMDEIQIDGNGHVIQNPSPGHMNSRSGTMMTNMTGLNSPSAAYYPAPIPMNLKLPPLLSKKNRRLSRSGISPFPSPRKSSFSSALDKPGNRSSFMSPWSHTPDGSLLHYEGFAEDFERSGRSVHRQSLGSRGSSPLKKLYLSGDSREASRDASRDVSRLSRDFDEVYGEFDESAIDSSDTDLRDPYYNPQKRGRRRTMSLTSINVNMDNSEVREELDEGDVEGDVTDMQRYEASANAFTRVHIDSNAIVPPSAAAGYGNGISPGLDQKPGTLVEELELRKKDKKAVRGHLNKSMHQYAADGTETPLIQQIHDSQSAYGFDDRRNSLISDKRMSMMTGMSGMTGMTTKEHSYEDPNHHRMSLLALDSLAQMDYQQSYSKPGAAQISKQYKASRDDDEPLRVRKQRLKRQSQQLLEQRQLQENIEKQRLASIELEKKRQEVKQQRRNQFGQNAAAAGAQKKGKVLIGPGGEVIRT